MSTGLERIAAKRTHPLQRSQLSLWLKQDAGL